MISSLCPFLTRNLAKEHSNTSGCKHSKVDQTNAPVHESDDFLGEMPISSSKMLFRIYSFS